MADACCSMMTVCGAPQPAHAPPCPTALRAQRIEETYLPAPFSLLVRRLRLLFWLLGLVVALALVACVALGCGDGCGRTLAGLLRELGDVDLVVVGAAERNL